MVQFEQFSRMQHPTLVILKAPVFGGLKNPEDVSLSWDLQGLVRRALSSPQGLGKERMHPCQPAAV